MNGRIYRIGMIALVAAAFLLESSAIASSAIGGQSHDMQMQQSANANKGARRPRSRRGQGARAGKRAMRAKTGIPTGVQNCLDRLIEVAAADPLPAYEGQPEQIINDGLMWNDEKSKCSIGTDSAQRLRVLQLSNAWRMKDAAKVRSLLTEIKGAAPQA
ncbi:MAG TPA: hypothetical protein VNH22_20345 [Blastocatellia bacterium]|nr:hypothetical protein [Blastocatellia bacterium]